MILQLCKIISWGGVVACKTIMQFLGDILKKGRSEQMRAFGGWSVQGQIVKKSLQPICVTGE